MIARRELIILKEGKYILKELQELKKKTRPRVVDIYFDQLRELFEIKNPSRIRHPDFEGKFLEFKKKKMKRGEDLSGDWIYYGWSNILLHTLSEKEIDLLKTNRNKNIITAEEQKNLVNFTIAIAGLSVGGNIATTLLHNGFPKQIKLADSDTLDTTNLNRVRAKLSDIGSRKIDIISRQLYEIDPYIKIVPFANGLSKKNLKSFVAGSPKPKLIFEIIDDFEMKILIRKEAKKHRIPVIMLTSLGDSVLIDVERYDIQLKTKIFNGLVNEKIINEILTGKIGEEDKKKYAIQIVGPKNIPERVIQSVKGIGKTLVGRPQLMSTVTVASGLAAFLARKIALGEKILSGRTLVKFDDFIHRKTRKMK